MNRSWKSNSNSSSGFVYFNVNNSYQNSPAETSDYLSFEGSPTNGSPKSNGFSPSNYSSPQKFQKSPRRFNNRKSFRYSSGPPIDRSCNSFNNSFNSSCNNSRQRKSGHQHRKNHNSFNNGDRDSHKKDMSKFFDHTSVKDPWAELEANLKKTQKTETKEEVKDIGNNDSPAVNNDESSSTSEEEQENESESKTSTSRVDEEAT